MWLARASQAGRAGRAAERSQALQSARGLVQRAMARQPDDPQTLSRLATLEGHIGMALGGSAAVANQGRVDEALGHLQAAVGQFERLRAREPVWRCKLKSRPSCAAPSAPTSPTRQPSATWACWRWRASVPAGAQPPGLFAPWTAPLRAAGGL